LETLKGVGQDSAAVYASFIGDPRRFSSTRLFRGWTGMVPASEQRADTEAKGLHITQAGPDLIKKYAYLLGGHGVTRVCQSTDQPPPDMSCTPACTRW
jgi:hypothetical protein